MTREGEEGPGQRCRKGRAPNAVKGSAVGSEVCVCMHAHVHVAVCAYPRGLESLWTHTWLRSHTYFRDLIHFLLVHTKCKLGDQVPGSHMVIQ